MIMSPLPDFKVLAERIRNRAGRLDLPQTPRVERPKILRKNR
jgi:hypothetical protein